MALTKTSVLLDDVGPLKMAANRYTPADTNDRGLTLLFAHCIGAHKEHWEPVIEYIFSYQQLKRPEMRVREAWSVDWQSHGDSAVANRDMLSERGDAGVSAYEWASSIAALVRSGRLRGHRIVPLGHSAGTGTLMVTMRGIPISEIPYSAIILVEPMIITKEMFYSTYEERKQTIDFMIGSILARRDTWPSRDAALKMFKKRLPWMLWDERAVRILVEHGLRDTEDGQVTLKCHKKHEAFSYTDLEPHWEAVTELNRIAPSIPVHFVWAERMEISPEDVQNALSQNSPIASVTRLPDCGHFVVQEAPEILAQAIYKALDTIKFLEGARL